MKTLIASLAIALPSIAFGLLPPLYESLAEFKSLINDERLPQSLDSGELILDVKKRDGSFIVTTNKRAIVITVVHEKSNVIGPAKFHLQFPTARQASDS
jgi:hypothetical protein